MTIRPWTLQNTHPGLSPGLSRSGFDIRPLFWPLTIIGALFVLATFIPPHGYDLRAYWGVDPLDPYATSSADLSGQGVFRYAPPVALLFAPLGRLPIEAAQLVWLALQLGALWMIGRRWFLALVLFPPVWLDLLYGNLNVMLAAAAVIGFRYAGTWAFVLLTKVTPGIGLVWFVVRREWRALAVVAGVTLAVVGTSVAIQGVTVWREWLDVLGASSAQPIPWDSWPVPLLPRLAAAAVVVAWGGLTDRRWTVPVAVTLAMPVWWIIAFAPLVGLASPTVWRGTNGPVPRRTDPR